MIIVIGRSARHALDGPDHAAVPARMSVLMLPARGMVARLLEPLD
jgi:hypothetical protein